MSFERQGMCKSDGEIYGLHQALSLEDTDGEDLSDSEKAGLKVGKRSIGL